MAAKSPARSLAGMPGRLESPDLDTRRRRLNAIPLAIGVGLGLAPVAMFWIRFFPPLRPFEFTVPAPAWYWIVFGFAVGFVPYLVPVGRGRVRQWPGMNLFRLAAPDGVWINARLRAIDPTYRVVRNRAELRAHLKSSEDGLRAHWMFLILSALTTVFAWRIGELWTAALLIVGNVIYNVYPILHQRAKRARVRHRA
jgi:hypothetical protein